MTLARCEVPEDVTKVLQLVGEGKRVLSLGDADVGLLRALEAQGCEITRTPVDRTDRRDNAPTPVQTSDDFDVVLAVNTLEHVRDPLALLKDVKKKVRRDGFLVARVPNVAHGSVRLAILTGRFPFADGYEPVRFFTYESLVALFEKAGFAIGVIERQEADVTPPDGPAEAGTADLLEKLSAAPEFRTLQFVVVAYPLPSPGLGWLQTRLRALAEQNAVATREAAEFRQDLAAIKGHVQLLIEQQESSLRRERQLQAKVLEVHDQLARRDEELRAAHRGAQESAARSDAADSELARREKYAFELLRELEKMTRYKDELEAGLGILSRNKDELEVRLVTVSRQKDEVEARLARFRRSLPGRVYRFIRGLWKK
ncbi:putative glycosyltransferase [Fimbriiglobus ruber]|uniref:Putative glycosyltransferase n=1 Tax=Fimbriiglobus ruber TaxID=1908690 RepID=A0A225DR97_9BACT|nr:putative glycosyltransferase [Fimbriiglobus ruber]